MASQATGQDPMGMGRSTIDFSFIDRSFSTKGYFLVISPGRNPSHISILFSSLMNWAEGGAGVIWRH